MRVGPPMGATKNAVSCGSRQKPQLNLVTARARTANSSRGSGEAASTEPKRSHTLATSKRKSLSS